MKNERLNAVYTAAVLLVVFAPLTGCIGMDGGGAAVTEVGTEDWEGPINPGFDAEVSVNYSGNFGAAAWNGQCASRVTGADALPSDGSWYLSLAATTYPRFPGQCEEAWAAQDDVSIVNATGMTFDWQFEGSMGPFGSGASALVEIRIGGDVLWSKTFTPGDADPTTDGGFDESVNLSPMSGRFLIKVTPAAGEMAGNDGLGGLTERYDASVSFSVDNIRVR